MKCTGYCILKKCSKSRQWLSCIIFLTVSQQKQFRNSRNILTGELKHESIRFLFEKN